MEEKINQASNLTPDEIIELYKATGFLPISRDYFIKRKFNYIGYGSAKARKIERGVKRIKNNF